MSLIQFAAKRSSALLQHGKPGMHRISMAFIFRVSKEQSRTRLFSHVLSRKSSRHSKPPHESQTSDGNFPAHKILQNYGQKLDSLQESLSAVQDMMTQHRVLARQYKSTIQWRRRAKWMLPNVLLLAVFIGGFCAWNLEAGLYERLISKRSNMSVLYEKDVKKRRYGGEAHRKAVKNELVKVLGLEAVSDDPGACVNHSSTAWSEAPNGDNDRGLLIVYPRSTEDVVKIVKICSGHEIPMIPFSGGTSLESTLAAMNSEVYVDFSRMDKVLQLHQEDMDVTVQPGVGFLELNQYLSDKKLFFPPDPGPGAQVGGMIAQGCSGTNAYRYGTVKDWVLGLTVVLADGTVIKTRHRPRKSSAGYDLTRLFVGSEGTLGFITEAHLRLAALPEGIRVAVAQFPNLDSAIKTSVSLVNKEISLAAMELLDSETMRAVNVNGHLGQPWPETTTLFFKFSGDPETVSRQAKQVESISKSNSCSLFRMAGNQEETDQLWTARKTALWSLPVLKKDPDDKFISADVCVPISRLGDAIAQTNKSFQDYGLVGSCLGHVGDGNFHASLFYSEAERDRAMAAMEAVKKMGVEMSGTVSGEHGIGLVSRDALIWELGEESVAAMRMIKFALDPKGLLNPGKVFRLSAEDVKTEEAKRLQAERERGTKKSKEV